MTDREIDALVDHRICWARLSEIPRYSTDPAGWDQVLDKMAADGWMFSLENVRLISTDPMTFKVRFRGLGTPNSFTAEDSTKGRAICLAALEAVKGQA